MHNRKFQKNSKKIYKSKKSHFGLILRQISAENNENERQEKLLVCSVPTRREIENSKKIAKKFKKFKNIFMASFQAIIGWKRLRKRENNKYRFVSSLPDSR